MGDPCILLYLGNYIISFGMYLTYNSLNIEQKSIPDNFNIILKNVKQIKVINIFTGNLRIFIC